LLFCWNYSFSFLKLKYSTKKTIFLDYLPFRWRIEKFTRWTRFAKINLVLKLANLHML